MKNQTIFILLATFAYALARYVLFGPVSPVQIPVYILNKAVSMGSVIFLLLACFYTFREDSANTRHWGTLTFHTALIHILLSLTIFSSGYYPGFFHGERLSLAGEVLVLSGVLAWYCYWLLRKPAKSLQAKLGLKMMASVLIALHVLAMGYAGWFKIHDWHGYLPPISLISFGVVLGCVCLLAANLRRLAKQDFS